MSKYTLGPWEVREDKEFKHPFIKAGGIRVATFPLAWSDKKHKKEFEANAHLIAAAPELLNALKGAIFYVKKVAVTPGDLNDLRLMEQAIAKAEGDE